MAPQSPPLLRDDRDGIATLTLNRPGTRNALSSELMTTLQAELDEITDTPRIRVVVLAANGPVFCSGHDLKEIRSNPEREAYQKLFSMCSKLMVSITRLPQPVIARIQGTASAAGCQLVATCDLAVAVETACFATPGVNIGLFCSTPMVALSRNLGRKQAMEMLLTGEMIDAQTACAGGLVNQVSTEKALDETVNKWCIDISSKSPLTIKIGKEAYYQQLDMPLTEAYEHATKIMVENMMTHDAEEGIDAFLEKRNPVWQGN